MSIQGEMKGSLVRQNQRESLWAVRRGSPQWAGWVHWQNGEFGKRFFPDWLTVPFEWPPTTQEGADLVAKWLSDIRDGKYLNEKSPIGGAPVPKHPIPWTGAKSLPAFMEQPGPAS